MRIGQTSLVGFLSQFFASVIGFAATVLITQTLGAAVFGEYMLVLAVAIWLQVLGILGIENATTKRLSEPGDSNAYFSAGGLLVLAAFALLSILVLVFSTQINAYVGRDVAVWIPGLLFAGILFKFIIAALNGEHKVHIAELLQPVERTIRSILHIAVVVLGLGLVGLLAGYIVAGVLGGILGLGYLSARVERPTRSHIDGITSYAKYAWLGRIGSRMFASMDTLVLGVFVSSTLIGFYEAAWNLASILAVFGVAISRALFPEISRVASEGDTHQVSHLVNDGLTYSGILLIPGLVGSIFIGDLVLQVYGAAFQRAAVVLVVLVAGRLVYEYGNQFINGLNGIDRPDLAFRVNAAFILTNVVLNVGLVFLYGWIGAAVATAVSALVAALLAYALFTRLVPVDLPVGEVGKQLLAAIGMGAVVYLGQTVLPDRVLVGVGLVAIGATCYLLLLLALSAEFRSTIRQNLAM